MTYDEARRWLEKIGGRQVLAREQGPWDSVIVIVKTAKGTELSRHAIFRSKLAGAARERAIRKAFVRACEELRYALR